MRLFERQHVCGYLRDVLCLLFLPHGRPVAVEAQDLSDVLRLEYRTEI